MNFASYVTISRNGCRGTHEVIFQDGKRIKLVRRKAKEPREVRKERLFVSFQRALLIKKEFVWRCGSVEVWRYGCWRSAARVLTWKHGGMDFCSSRAALQA